MYFESHINTEQLTDPTKRTLALAICRETRMKISDMDGHDHLDNPKRVESVLTGHSRDRADLERRTRDTVRSLKLAKIAVTRYKIEQALVDSRMGDSWGLL